jgi:uncharacterized protein (DUF427 family)
MTLTAYPNPSQVISKPSIDLCSSHIKITLGGEVIAVTTESYCVRNPNGSVVYFIPPKDVREELLYASSRHSICEYKGVAGHYHVSTAEKTVHHAVRSFTNPHPSYANIRNYYAFNPGMFDSCEMDGKKVESLKGDLIGHWVVPSDII